MACKALREAGPACLQPGFLPSSLSSNQRPPISSSGFPSSLLPQGLCTFCSVCLEAPSLVCPLRLSGSVQMSLNKAFPSHSNYNVPSPQNMHQKPNCSPPHHPIYYLFSNYTNLNSPCLLVRFVPAGLLSWNGTSMKPPISVSFAPHPQPLESA